MDPLYEQRLRDEVVFLHSLWHQGPPRPAAAATHHHLQPSEATHSKNKKPDHRNKRRKTLPNSTSSHGAEWPCPATPPSPTAWPPAAAAAPEPPPLSAEDQSKSAAKTAHRRALETVREFLIGNGSGDDSGEIESSDDDEEYGIFKELFEDNVLKEYYEKNFAVEEFGCLVCGAVVGGKNSTKKFKGCLPLVQHSIANGKMKRRSAHRAFARAVCGVLGWDINRLPEIVSKLSERNGNIDNKEWLVALPHNVDSVKDGEEPASDAASKDLVDIRVDVDEPASDGLTVSSSTCQDADKTEIEVHPRGDAATVSTSAAVPTTSHHMQPPSEAEWPCPSPPHQPSTTGWATPEKSSLKAHVPSTKEHLISASRHAHQCALKVVHEFFSTNKSDDDSDETDSGSDDDDELMEEGSGCEEKYSFFFKVFEEGTELREYYMKNFSEGEFSCLVCGAAGGKNSGKKFKGCLPLVQHSVTIAKTKKRKAHRAFGRAVCKVLDWDIDRLHEIAAKLSDKTGEVQDSKEEPVSSVDNVDLVKDNILEGQIDKAAPEIGDVGVGISPNGDDGHMNLTVPDADRNSENGNLHASSLEDPIAE